MVFERHRWVAVLDGKLFDIEVEFHSGILSSVVLASSGFAARCIRIDLHSCGCSIRVDGIELSIDVDELLDVISSILRFGAVLYEE